MTTEINVYDIQSTYEQRESVYFEKRYDEPKFVFKTVGEKIHDRLAHTGDGRLLDVGGATGEFVYYLNQIYPNIKTVCLEYSQELIDRGKNHVPNSEFIQGDANHMPMVADGAYHVTTMLGTILLLISLGKGRLLLLGIPLLLVALVAGGFLVHLFAPEAFRIYMIRFERLAPLLTFDIKAADPFRYGEFMNCFGDMAKDGTLLVGRGFGGYYTDKIVPLGGDLISAFPPWVEQVRHFPRVHFVAGHFVLKFGLIGLALWLAVWWRIFKTLFRSRFLSPEWNTLRVVLLAMTPAVFLSGYWSSKGIILTGFFLVLTDYVRTRAANGCWACEYPPADIQMDNNP